MTRSWPIEITQSRPCALRDSLLANRNHLSPVGGHAAEGVDAPKAALAAGGNSSDAVLADVRHEKPAQVGAFFFFVALCIFRAGKKRGDDGERENRKEVGRGGCCLRFEGPVMSFISRRKHF